MRIFRILYFKELKSYFLSPFGWLILCFASLMQGFALTATFKEFSDNAVAESLVSVVFNSPIFNIYLAGRFIQVLSILHNFSNPLDYSGCPLLSFHCSNRCSATIHEWRLSWGVPDYRAHGNALYCLRLSCFGPHF